MSLLEEIEAYQPFNEQEERDRELILHALREEPEVFTRKNTMAHMTASAWVVNPPRDRVLLAYHNIYHSWSWLGGHADGETDLLQTALREVKEESGLQEVTPLSRKIFSLEVLTVDGHIKHGAYVSSHLHLNVTYLVQADDQAPIRKKADENSAVAWFALADALKASSEPWFVEHIYSKLNEKLVSGQYQK